jgi:hypothetical protein
MPAWHDPHAKSGQLAVVSDVGFSLRVQGIDRAFGELGHVMSPDFRAAPRKQAAKAYENIIWPAQKYCREQIRLADTKSKSPPRSLPDRRRGPRQLHPRGIGAARLPARLVAADSTDRGHRVRRRVGRRRKQFRNHHDR